MCAIAGVIGLELPPQTEEQMLLTMKRRGPDGNGVWKNNQCAFLHSRLAVIDPVGGAQPMEIRQGSERYVIVYNGELYNTLELRTQLQHLGHSFRSRSDTEVILTAYIQWGEACLERMNGIYAFAILEVNRNRIFLARDRIGVKPLFYSQHRGGLLFASEIKTILCYPGFPRQLDAQGAAEILMLGPGRTPGCGVFKNIQELEPGCCGYVEEGKLRIKRYWLLRDQEHRESFDETAEHVRYLVTDAIRRQTVSDVPLGAFLSGGLDSSLICAICSGAFYEKGEVLPTFSVDYEGNEKNFKPNDFQPNSDNHYITFMQQRLHTQHKSVVLDAQQLFGALEESTIARDLPGMSDVDFSLQLFCGEIRKDVKVALSGECADEIFGGYPWYRDPRIRSVDGFPWAQSTPWRKSFLLPWVVKEIDGEEYVRQRYEQTIRESDILPQNSPLERRMKEMVNLNFRWFMQTLLDRKDRMSMYHGLEVRVPFCDHRIAEYMYGVPWEFKDYKGREKGLLRYAMASYLPEEVLWRKKSPYPKTFDPAYFMLVRKKLEQLLQEKDAPIFSLVSQHALQQLLRGEYAWPWYGQLMNIPQTIAYMLQIDFWLRSFNIQIVGSC